MILFVSYSGALGGAERLLVDYAAALPGERSLACPEGALAGAARDAGVRVFAIPRRSLHVRGRRREPALAAARLFAHAWELRRLARDLDPDLVVAWGMRSAIATMLGGPRYLFAHNDLLPGTAIGAVVRRAGARAQVVVALSETIAAELRGPGIAVEVVHPGIDVSVWGPQGTTPVQPPEAVVLGALVGWKAPELALEALALARRELPELRLRFVGEPLDGDTAVRDGLRHRVQELGLSANVEFAGFEPDPRATLARATCLLHCAPREPFGLVVLEALASGRPAVVPAAGGPAEIVDSQCGVLYPPGDAVAAARSLVDVAADPARAAALGRAGRERARAHFDLGRARRRFSELVGAAARDVRPAPTAAFALVTVTHNSAPQLEGLLASVDRHLPGVRTVVVDSGSDDDSVAVARAHPSATSIALGENAGFGAATNRGVAAVFEPVAVLLNPDVELLDGSLRALAAAAATGPDRLIAPRVLTAAGGREDNVHPVPASPADLVSVTIPPALVSGSAAAPWGSQQPRRVGWAVGCAVAARTDVLRRLGPFDEAIFLYGEDLDLGLRAADAGVETWFWPAARVLHHRGHATSAAFGGEAFERLARARRDVIARRLGGRRAGLDDAAQALTFGARIAVKPLLGRSAARERAQLSALRAARRGARS